MVDIERIIGELKEFKRATLSELDEIKKDVKSLNSFKFKMVGASAAISAFVVHLMHRFWS